MTLPTRSAFRPREGVALVVVLCILVLLTAVVVGFLADSATDLSSTKSYSEVVRAKLLADSALNVVEGQIRAGTVGFDSGHPVLAWASQPGMVRTFDTTGNLAAAYKLYSSDTLQLPNATNTAVPTNASLQAVVAAEFPADWNTRPADFVDLNSPELVPDPNGSIAVPAGSANMYTARFPIIDGNNLKTGLSNMPTSAATGGPLLGYDANGDGVADIEGFAVQQLPTYDSTKPLGAANNPVPMPVRWIYVLQDGELHARDATGTIAGASKTNPVVGRIAFWTDDDTCKLNVNTASEGTFWDRPWVQSATETNFANFVPAQNEFQMYPGHPAKTCLSTVLGSVWPLSATATDRNPVVTTSTYSNWRPYYDLTPRVSEASKYGSAGGTQAAPSPTPAYPATGVPLDTDRLYASLDEIMFKPTVSGSDSTARQARSVATTDSSATSKGVNIPALSPQTLEIARFFLTASNRAPEVTLFNTPRVSLWPIQADPTYQTAKDSLLAFCSTIPKGSSSLYYFQRATATHSASGAATPVTSPPLSCESPTTDMNIPRNGVIYSYLQNLLSSAVPGLGGNFQTKYTSPVTNQIIAEMLDQIRSGVNTAMSDPTDPNAYSYTQPQPAPLTTAQQAANFQASHGPSGISGAGQVVPLQTSGGRGFGRFNTIVEAAVVFFRVTPEPKPPPNYESKANIGACLILEPSNPTPGLPAWSPSMRIEVSGLDQWQLAGIVNGAASTPVALGFPGSVPGAATVASTNIVNAYSSYLEDGASTELNGLASMFCYNTGTTTSYKTFGASTGVGTSAGNATIYPFSNAGANGDLGCTITMDPPVVDSKTGLVTTPAMCTLYGYPLTIKIYSNPAPGTGTPVLLQTLTMPFPPGGTKFPVPTYPTNSGAPTIGYATVSKILGRRISTDDGGHHDDYTRLPMVGSALIDPNDVVKSVIVDPTGPSKGDYRVIAALASVPSNYFTTHPFYDWTAAANGSAVDPAPANAAFNRKFAHNLRSGFITDYGGFGWYDYTGATDTGDYVDKSNTSYPSAITINGKSTNPAHKTAYRGALVANLPTTNLPQPAYYRDAMPGGLAPGLGVVSGSYGACLSSGTGNTPGDWDTGFGMLEDGAYVNKPDEANGQVANTSATYAQTAYFNRGAYIAGNGQGYSPNRQIASAVAFGSLPTGIDQTSGATPKPWQTLLFCAHPPAGLLHPGFGSQTNKSSSGYPVPPYTTIPDHIVLDLFTMPTVEPYAISEPLSSQGKVNMNYQITPFTYIRRDTGVRAVMKGTWLTAIPTNAAEIQTSCSYKQQLTQYATQIRYAINPEENGGTLQGFEDRFNTGDVFRSASEICGLPLVPRQIATINNGLNPSETYPSIALPASATYTAMTTWWNSFKLTGDNLREAPYGDLYPRLTTKSNTFTVHVRVQALKKTLGTDVTTFVDPAGTTAGAKDTVTAEYRGSYQIERYVDPSVAIPDYAAQPISATTALGKFYKFHTILTKTF